MNEHQVTTPELTDATVSAALIESGFPVNADTLRVGRALMTTKSMFDLDHDVITMARSYGMMG